MTWSLFKLSNVSPSSLNFPRVCWRGLHGASVPAQVLCVGAAWCPELSQIAPLAPAQQGSRLASLSSVTPGPLGGRDYSFRVQGSWVWADGHPCFLPEVQAAFTSQLSPSSFPFPQQAEGVAFPPLHHSKRLLGTLAGEGRPLRRRPAGWEQGPGAGGPGAAGPPPLRPGALRSEAGQVIPVSAGSAAAWGSLGV